MLPNVRRSDGSIEPWYRERIVDMLVEETRLTTDLHKIWSCPIDLAKDLALRTEATVGQLAKCSPVSSHLVREIVCQILRENGMDTWADMCDRVGMSVYDACAIDVGRGFNAHDNANQLNPPEKAHKDKADYITKQQNLALFPQHIRKMHLDGLIHIHDLEYFRTRIFCQDYDLRWLFYYGLIPTGNYATSAVAKPARGPEVAVLQAVKLMGAGQTHCAGGQGFYNFLTFIAPYLRGLDAIQIKQLMQMLVYELMQMYVARGGQSLRYDEPIITRYKNGVDIAPIGELCHRYLNGAGSVAVNDDIEVMSLNKSTGEFEWKPLTAVHVHVPVTPIVRTVLKDGRHVTTTSDHSLFTLTPDVRFIETSPASEPGHIIAAYRLPEIGCQDVDTDLAFLIGVCIGDGSLVANNNVANDAMQIYLSDQSVRARVGKVLMKCGKPDINWHEDARKREGMYGRFSTIGIPYITEIGNGAAQKRIPSEILAASNNVLTELLDGLLSTDGNVSRRRYEFTTTSETLASQVQFIALRLGLQFNVSRRESESNFTRNYPVIRIQFNAASSRKIKVTNSTRQIDVTNPVGPDQTNHDFSVIRQALSDESDVPLWKESNAFRAKCNRIKREHLDIVAEHVPVVYRKVKNVLPMEVKNITRLDTPEYVYDVSVADNENFVLANGIVAHNTIFSSLQLSPGVPRIWRKEHPVYMGAQMMDETYGDFEREVRLAFNALMEVMIEGDAQGKPFAFPKPEISIEPCFVEPDDWVNGFNVGHPWLPTYDELYMKAAQLAAKFGTPYFDNQMPEYRGAGDGISCYQCCAYNFAKSPADDPDFNDKMTFKNGKHFSMGSMMVVSMNLPRVAYTAGCDVDNAIDWTKVLMDYCVEIFEIKQKAVAKLLENGRLPFLSQNPQDMFGDVLPGGQLVDFEGLVYTIGIVGLDDAIKACTDYRMYESEESLQSGLRWIAELQEHARKLSAEHGFEIALARTPAETTAQRFAVKDLLDNDPNISEVARDCVQGDVETAIELASAGALDLPVYYTNGTHVPPAASVSTPERINLEQKFFPLIDGGNIMHIWLGEGWTNYEGLYDLIMSIARNTQAGYFAFTKNFTTCNDCGNVVPHLVKECCRCGSREVDWMSRITGYLSSVSGWNAGKRQELKDRQGVTEIPVIETKTRRPRR